MPGQPPSQAKEGDKQVGPAPWNPLAPLAGRGRERGRLGTDRIDR